MEQKNILKVLKKIKLIKSKNILKLNNNTATAITNRIIAFMLVILMSGNIILPSYSYANSSNNEHENISYENEINNTKIDIFSSKNNNENENNLANLNNNNVKPDIKNIKLNTNLNFGKIDDLKNLFEIIEEDKNNIADESNFEDDNKLHIPYLEALSNKDDEVYKPSLFKSLKTKSSSLLNSNNEGNEAGNESNNEEIDWKICIYLCGSNLETKFGSATNDLIEMINAKIPSNVKVYVLTGGSKKWNPKNITYPGYVAPSKDSTQLWEINDDGMVLRKDYGLLNMADINTLYDFLNDCDAYAESNHTMAVLWDHGGGPMYGTMDDEIFDKHFSVKTIANAFESFNNKKGRKVDIIGFDACLMGSFEIGYLLKDSCDYLLASEHSEPGEGWYYDWLTSLYDEYTDGDDKKTLTPCELGVEIVNTYATSITNSGLWSDAIDCSLALFNLNKMDDLKEAFRSFVTELSYLQLDDTKFINLCRLTNTLQEVFSERGLIDFYNFADLIVTHMQDETNLKKAALGIINVLGTPCGRDPENYVGYVNGDDPLVVYRGTGAKNDNCLGLSLFYPTLLMDIGDALEDGVPGCIKLYDTFGINDRYPLFLYHLLVTTRNRQVFNGKLSCNLDYDLGHYKLDVDPSSEFEKLQDATFNVYFVDKAKNFVDDDSITLLLGEIPADINWSEGQILDNFDQAWYTLDGYYITAFVENINDTFEYVTIPVACYDVLYMMKIVRNKQNNTMYIEKIYEYGEDDSRYIRPNVDIPFTPVIFQVDANGNMNEIKAIWLYDTEIIAPYYSYYGVCILNNNYDITLMQKEDLLSGNDALYYGRFIATDFAGTSHESDVAKFAIIKYMNQFSINEISPKSYTGEAIEPEIILTFDGDIITTDMIPYQVEYINNVEIGTATAIVSAPGTDIEGQIEITFEIVEQDTLIDLQSQMQYTINMYNSIINDSSFDEITHTHGLTNLFTYMDKLKYSYELLDMDDRNIFSKNIVKEFNTIYNNILNSGILLDDFILNFNLKQNDIELLSFINFDQDDIIDIIEYFMVYFNELYPSHEKNDDDMYLTLKVIDTDMENSSQKAKLDSLKETNANFYKCLDTKLFFEISDLMSNKLKINDSKEFLLKYKVTSLDTNTIKLYYIPFENGDATELSYNIITEDKESYAIFQMPCDGYLAVFAKEAKAKDNDKPGTGGSSSGGRSSGGGSSSSTSSKQTEEKTNADNKDNKEINITSNKDEGSINISNSNAKKGDEVIAEIIPNVGYKTGRITITSASGKEIAITILEDNKISFIMPDGKININAEFILLDENNISNNHTPFKDIDENEWYYEGIKTVFDNNLMSGTKKDSFSPNKSLTRDMIVTILWRLENMPVVNYALKFKDVKNDEWYTEAIRWAASTKLINGYDDETYGTGDDITREDLSLILQRYLINKNDKFNFKDIKDFDINNYVDNNNFSDYAKDAIKWITDNNIMNGCDSGEFNAKKTATRAEVATILTRILNSMK